MARWQHTLDFVGVIGEDESSEAVKEAAQKVHNILEHFRLEHYPDDSELEDISDQFHTMGFVDVEPDCDEFNYVWNMLYNWADDEHRLWVKTL